LALENNKIRKYKQLPTNGPDFLHASIKGHPTGIRKAIGKKKNGERWDNIGNAF
jgi:hypothetical protein